MAARSFGGDARAKGSQESDEARQSHLGCHPVPKRPQQCSDIGGMTTPGLTTQGNISALPWVHDGIVA